MVILFCVLFASVIVDAVQGHGYEYHADIDGWIKAHKTMLLYYEAYERCQAEGAELAAPVTIEMRLAMESLIGVNNHTTEYFIGVRKRHHQNLFTALNAVSIDEMPVSDIIDYLETTGGHCLTMSPEKIKVVSCDTRYPYICFRKNDGRNVTKCGTFDEGYVYVESTNRCYKVNEVKKPWHQAYYLCVAEGGFLAPYRYFSGQGEPNILKWLPWNCNEDLYIGMIRESADFTAINVSGENITYHIAGVEEDKRCLVLSKSGSVYASSCLDNRPYLCEMIPRVRFPSPKK